MEKVPQGSIAVIESSTTGKYVLSRMLSGKYEVHMVAPPERKVSIKTDRRDAERIVMEDMLNYLRRCYIPSQYIENIRFVVTQQIQIADHIDILGKYHEDSDYIAGKDLSNKNKLKQDILR